MGLGLATSEQYANLYHRPSSRQTGVRDSGMRAVAVWRAPRLASTWTSGDRGMVRGQEETGDCGDAALAGRVLKGNWLRMLLPVRHRLVPASACGLRGRSNPVNGWPLVQSIPERLAGFERCRCRGGDGHAFAGARIAGRTGGPAPGGECPEAEEADGLIPGQRPRRCRTAWNRLPFPPRTGSARFRRPHAG